MPLVTVIIPTINRPQLVERAVRSALDQTLTDIEVMVVVDGPDDATTTVLGRIDDPRVRIVPLPAKGSRMIPWRWLQSRRASAMRLTGLTVGCRASSS